MTVSGSTVSASYLPAGIYDVIVHSNTYGYASITPSTVTIAFPADPTITASVTSSFAGGRQLTINGAGFVTNNP
jgi:hypothetical protein